MATGVSKTKWNGARAHQAKTHIPEAAQNISLAYAGKRTESEILATQPTHSRLLWQGSHGDILPSNRLYFGDNLPILAALMADSSICGQVRLVYIDPPFATRSVFQSRSQADAYSDLLAGPPYLEFMRERLILLRELLADDGSIYVHLDDNMAFHIKVIMDEVFGGKNFRNWITRKKCNPKNFTRKAYGNVADYILFYSKSAQYVWNRQTEPWGDDRHPKEYQYVETGTGRRYMKVPVHAPGVRNGETGKPWRGMLPPQGKHWQYPPATLDAMDTRGEIYWSPNGNPRRKVYLDESQGIPVQDIWLDLRDAHNQNILISGYPTEKNPDLLARIIRASSDEGDIVLDCFSGSGTALAQAAHLNRRWIGIDNSAEALGTSLRRFAKGLERMGDYVPSHQKKHKRTLEPLPLFPLLESSSKATASLPGDEIRDFSLFASEPYAGELDAALTQWRQWQLGPGSD